jgi:hypothetical protein
MRSGLLRRGVATSRPPVVTGPSSSAGADRSALRLRGSDPTTERRPDLPSASRLSAQRAQETGDTGASGSGDAPPTREVTDSTGWGAVRRTGRSGSGMSLRLRDDVLVPAAQLSRPEPGMRRCPFHMVGYRANLHAAFDDAEWIEPPSFRRCLGASRLMR